MKKIATSFADVFLLEPRVFSDGRGFFLESWNARTFAEAGIDATFVQDNHSCSARGVLRGLHYQTHQTQGKLVRVLAGAVFDAVVDLRRSSTTFGRWEGFHLDAESKRQLWVPPGFAHGFLSLEDGTEFFYKCTDFYAPAHEVSLAWNDPALGIEWPLEPIGQPILALKDMLGITLDRAPDFP
jgi:dTDP-4-dehydrorhamnose 3,5-epimerase